jgi:hypothetical protein
VTLRQPPNDLPCTVDDSRGCAALVGQIALVRGATGDAPAMTTARDGNAWHFMRRPTSIAFGTNGNLATCGEARTDNYTDEEVDYAGPVLWSSDPAIFGVRPQPGQNGTHLDMLHETPFCMGIAHERDNVYWTFQRPARLARSLRFPRAARDRRRRPLGRRAPPLRRWPALARARSAESSGARRAAPPAVRGGQRTLARAAAGHRQRNSGHGHSVLEPLVVHRNVDGATLAEVVSPGVLAQPSGLTFVDDVLIVTEPSGGIFFFDRDGQNLGKFETGLTSLSGVALGPDGMLYVADRMTGAYRVQTP